ncbi:Regulatory protein [Rhodotorula toruloides ATCC 204091]|uniref:Regulatory protein n=1 Tax=Rhodotorula toruloides TaxID=5286 RepID=A0A0K3CI90_RHOTO|nr:Regulatory protein [Rhodotorula toruloides ATCC 204091]PRQ72027.1 regulatory protein [Rhodotorula toruloides]
MPSDLRSTGTTTRSPAPKRPSPPSTSTSRPLLRTFLVCFFAALYALAAIRWSLPPHSWAEKWIARRVALDRAAWTRPGLRTVERQSARFGREAHRTSRPSRYSPQHKYRPAAAPVITSVGMDGKGCRVQTSGQAFTPCEEDKATPAPPGDTHDHGVAPGQPAKLGSRRQAGYPDKLKRSSAGEATEA